MNRQKLYVLIYIISFIFLSKLVTAQFCENPTTNNCSDVINGSSRFIMTTPGNIDFVFDRMDKYVRGITYSGGTRFMLQVDELVTDECMWKLVVFIDNNDAEEDNEWDELATYGISAGTVPELDLLEVKVYNHCETPTNNILEWSSFDPLNFSELDIIPETGIRVEPGACDGSEVNTPGSYLIDYNEFNFVVDYRIRPEFIHKPGAYQVTLRFCLVEY